MFKQIKNTNYYINEFGTIINKNKKNPKPMKCYTKPSGYQQIQLGRNKPPQYVHRLVAETFIPNPDNKTQVDHIDGNKSNNCVNNLRWVTPHENDMAFGYENRKKAKHKEIIAFNNHTNELLHFESRLSCAEYFNCHSSTIEYGKEYKKGNKKGFVFSLG